MASTVLYGQRRNIGRTLKSLRDDLMYDLRKKDGVQFPGDCSILSDEAADQKFLAFLCPETVNDSVSEGMAHLQHLFLMCNKWFMVIDRRSCRYYWDLVARDVSLRQKIELRGKMAMELTLACLKARQRWLLRHSANDVADPWIAPLQRFILHLETREAQNPEQSSPFGKRGWQLTEGEKQAARESLVRIGPKFRVSKNVFSLSPRGAQKLHPISELSGGPPTHDWVAFVDRSVETMTVAEAAILFVPPESAFPITRHSTTNSDRPVSLSPPAKKIVNSVPESLRKNAANAVPGSPPKKPANSVSEPQIKRIVQSVPKIAMSGFLKPIMPAKASNHLKTTTPMKASKTTGPTGPTKTSELPKPSELPPHSELPKNTNLTASMKSSEAVKPTESIKMLRRGSIFGSVLKASRAKLGAQGKRSTNEDRVMVQQSDPISAPKRHLDDQEIQHARKRQAVDRPVASTPLPSSLPSNESPEPSLSLPPMPLYSLPPKPPSNEPPEPSLSLPPKPPFIPPPKPSSN